MRACVHMCAVKCVFMYITTHIQTHSRTSPSHIHIHNTLHAIPFLSVCGARNAPIAFYLHPTRCSCYSLLHWLCFYGLHSTAHSSRMSRKASCQQRSHGCHCHKKRAANARFERTNCVNALTPVRTQSPLLPRREKRWKAGAASLPPGSDVFGPRAGLTQLLRTIVLNGMAHWRPILAVCAYTKRLFLCAPRSHSNECWLHHKS